MILQELVKYYDRLVDTGQDIALPGFSDEKIHFSVVITMDGRLVSLSDLREMNGKKVQPRIVRVPKLEGRVGRKIVPAFLWDKCEYFFGVRAKEKNEITEESPELWICSSDSLEKFTAFREAHEEALEKTENSRLGVFVRFLKKWNPENFAQITDQEECADLLKSNFIVEIEGENRFLHNDDSLTKYWVSSREIGDQEEGICLVSGERTPIARTHPSIKGATIGAQANSAIVGFNENAYTSYGKTQSYNSPVGEREAFAYTTVLNKLLGSDRQRLKIADTTLLFWAEKDAAFEDIFCGLLTQSKDDGFSKEIQTFLEKARKGTMPGTIDGSQRFFILGLSPNAARISVRLWYVSTVKDITDKMLLHFEQLEIVRQSEKNLIHPGVWWLLIETAAQHKTENIPPNLAGPFMMSILKGTHYPVSLVSILLSRIRVEKNPNYYKCALLKAILIRNFNKEVSVSLDKEKTDVAYLLGRLFAVLEKIQEESAGGKLNASIKDKYFASASTHPSVTFPLLIRLSQNHQKKLKSERAGRAVNFQKEIQVIMSSIDAFPSYLNLEDQGLFAIGYYHQYQSFFEKHDTENNVAEEAAQEQ
jgi:CRISPR-associated protein Csd1